MIEKDLSDGCSVDLGQLSDESSFNDSDANINFNFYRASKKKNDDNAVVRSVVEREEDRGLNLNELILNKRQSSNVELPEMISKEDTFKDAKQLNRKKVETAKPGFKKIVQSENGSFSNFGLSKCLMKAISEMEFLVPTPIQNESIPCILQGKDLFGCAKTGSGKTAAYMVPIVERLTRKREVRTNVLIIVPTRELALQVYTVFKGLTKHTKLTATLVVGGHHSKIQESQLSNTPDVIIATPGRLIDHLFNTVSFNLKNIEVLVLDEADRLMDESFIEQLEEIIKQLPRKRQCLLFSATLNEQVEKLGDMSLISPVKLYMETSMSTVETLQQEFVKLGDDAIETRFAAVASLITRFFTSSCLVFCDTKKNTTHLRVFLGLLGINVDEFHGQLTQKQRYEALEKFKTGEVGILIATNIAARGIDIEGIQTVININVPASLQDYIHRVGRTARAGNAGRSITLFTESGRSMLKKIKKASVTGLKMRIIDNGVLQDYKNSLFKLEPDIKAILAEKKFSEKISNCEKKVKRAENLIDYEEEIKSRPVKRYLDKKSSKNKNTGKAAKAKKYISTFSQRDAKIAKKTRSYIIEPRKQKPPRKSTKKSKR